MSLFSSQHPIASINILIFVSFLNARLEDYTERRKGGVIKRAPFYLKDIHTTFHQSEDLGFCKAKKNLPSLPNLRGDSFQIALDYTVGYWPNSLVLCMKWKATRGQKAKR